MFTENDSKQIARHGLTPEAVARQLENFRRGFPALKVSRAASPGDGIRVLAPGQVRAAAERYDAAAPGLRAVKFVPASGAATRMFRDLYAFLGDGERGGAIDTLLARIRDFAFWPELEALLPPDADARRTVDAIVNEGLGYGSQPKGLVTFHAYPEGARKAVEEHLAEGAQYAAGDGTARIHFTVSPEHMEGFRALLDAKAPEYGRRYGVCYDIGFSVQEPSTDTIAVDPDNRPFRTGRGELLFRPAGHGALIGNLDRIDADVIFVKNIDNVTTDARRGDTVLYKKALAGLLLDLRVRADEWIARLDAGDADTEAAAAFVERELCVKLPAGCDAALLRRVLDRPMRVCGMVRNEGEPGGGPFIAVNPDGSASLQILESHQIDPGNAEYVAKMKSATHFNPVDLVCYIKDRHGNNYNLLAHTDPATGFISSKSSHGKELKALELPGLWNGAMSDWNTAFVEVPVDTFNPVKTVNDLLRPAHQS